MEEQKDTNINGLLDGIDDSGNTVLDEEIKDIENQSQPLLAKAASGTTHDYNINQRKKPTWSDQAKDMFYNQTRAPSATFNIDIRQYLQKSDGHGHLSDVRSVAQASAYRQKQTHQMLIKSQPVPFVAPNLMKTKSGDIEMNVNFSNPKQKKKVSYSNHEELPEQRDDGEQEIIAEDFIADSDASSHYLAEHIKRQNEKRLHQDLRGMGFEIEDINKLINMNQDQILSTDEAVDQMFLLIQEKQLLAEYGHTFGPRDSLTGIIENPENRQSIISFGGNQTQQQPQIKQIIPFPEQIQPALLIVDNEEEKKDTGEKKMCDSCYEEVPIAEFFSLSCKHEFCKGCFEEHLEANIGDGKVMQIPCMQGCGVNFESQDVSKFGSADLYKKYLRFKQNIDVDLDDNLKWCPKPGCINYVRREKKEKKVVCACGWEVCFRCGKAWHEGVKCENAGDKEYEEWASKQGDVQDCPLCGIRTWKDGGCNKMTCRKCHAGWCWICSEGNIDYSHFRNGDVDMIGVFLGRTGCTGNLHDNARIKKGRKKLLWPLLLRLIFLPLLIIFYPFMKAMGVLMEAVGEVDSCVGKLFMIFIVLPVAIPIILTGTTLLCIVSYYPLLFALLTKIKNLTKQKLKISNCLWPCGWF